MANGADIAKAYVQIIPSADGIQGKLTEVMGGEAEKAGKSSGSKLGKALGKGFIGATAALATGTAAMTAGFVAASGQVAEFGDHIDKMSQKMGISAEAYQEWDAILQHSGTSIDSMQRGMMTLSKAAESGSDAFEALGISQEQIASMNQEELFSATITALQGMEEGTERTALASQLLGGSAKELGALLNTSAADTEAMRQRVHELGGVMSNDAVKAAAAYQDSLQDMKTALTGAKNSIMADFLPAMTTVMDGLTAIFSGDSSGLGKVKAGIKEFANQIAAAAPEIMTAGAEILVALTESIVENLPVLLDAAISAIETIVTGLLTPENISLLIDAALSIIMALMNGMVDALPLIIQAAVTLITTLCQKLGDPDTINKLLKAAWEIIKALAKGLWDAAPQIISAIGQVLAAVFTVLKQKLGEFLTKGKEIAGKIGEGIRNGISNIVSVGMDIVRGIWQGISNGFSWITGQIRSWVGNLVAFFKKILKIGSPSKVFADEVGKWMALGMGEGFVDEMGTVEDMMGDSIPTAFDLLGKPGFSATARGANAYNYGGVTIQILGRGKDADQLAVELQNALVRRAAAWA